MPKSVRVPLSRCTHFKAQPPILTQSLTHTQSYTRRAAYTQPSSATTTTATRVRCSSRQSISALGTQLIQLPHSALFVSSPSSILTPHTHSHTLHVIKLIISTPVLAPPSSHLCLIYITHKNNPSTVNSVNPSKSHTIFSGFGLIFLILCCPTRWNCLTNWRNGPLTIVLSKNKIRIKR